MQLDTSKIILISIGFAVVLAGSCVGRPHYRVWEQGMAGKARLEEAKQSRMIKIEEAKAAEQSASLLAAAKLAIAKGDAAAELERAKGAADAIELIGVKLKNNEQYLRYHWINGLHDGKGERIYIPTEGNLPILEATALAK